MADAVWLEFKVGMDEQLYDQVNARVNPAGSPPSGLIFHCSGPSPDGGWPIIDVWESRAAFDSFFAERVQPALVELVGEQALSQGPPPEITSWTLRNHNLGA